MLKWGVVLHMVLQMALSFYMIRLYMVLSEWTKIKVVWNHYLNRWRSNAYVLYLASKYHGASIDVLILEIRNWVFDMRLTRTTNRQTQTYHNGVTLLIIIYHILQCVKFIRCMMTSSNGTMLALLSLCAGNSPVTGEFPSQRPVTRSFDVFFRSAPWINGWVNNREPGYLRRHRARYDAILMDTINVKYIYYHKRAAN